MPRRLLALAGAIALALAAPAGAAPAPSADPFAAALAAGDAAFAARRDPARLAEALGSFRKAQSLRPGHRDAELRLARAEAFRALAEGDPAAARAAWERCARAGERALRALEPDWARAVDEGAPPEAAAARVGAGGAEALYWLALGSMHAAQATGYAAVLAVKDAALGMMDRVTALDEGLDAGGPHRALGAWRAALPVAAGGGATRAEGLFARARALAPNDLLGRVLEAETLAVLLQDAKRFDRLLDEVERFERSKWPERAPENALAQRRGEALRAKRARLF
ncbi:MAG TPA: TRAP transporter TatT component family protein [Anaeromyxobacteraceae bacterium]|nr:TRAP transporter TatT component family protein [Anaeromyxobacteraceae bacterium]